MNGTQIFLTAIGVFYAAAGVIAGRAALADAWLNAALDALGGTRDAIETERTWWLVGSAAIVSAGGLLLVVSSVWAVVAFLVSAVSQAAYLTLLAPKRYDVVDPPSPEGRRQTINAFWIYGAMTVVVCRAAWIGALGPVTSASLPWVIGVVALWAAGVVYAVHHLRQMTKLPPVTDE